MVASSSSSDYPPRLITGWNNSSKQPLRKIKIISRGNYLFFVVVLFFFVVAAFFCVEAEATGL